MSGNILTGSIPDIIGTLTNLVELMLDNNYLSGSIPVSLGNLTKLELLTLSENQLSGSIPSSLGNLQNLRWLLLRINLLSNTIPANLAKLKKIELLLLNQNRLSGNIPPELGELAEAPYPFIMDLSLNSLSGCFASNLKKICNKLVGMDENNGLAARWADFCATNAGECPCPKSLTLQSPSLDINSELRIFEADKTTGKITASNQITGNANVTYRAGKSIVLTPGFVVNQGTTFKTEYSGCN